MLVMGDTNTKILDTSIAVPNFEVSSSHSGIEKNSMQSNHTHITAIINN